MLRQLGVVIGTTYYMLLMWQLLVQLPGVCPSPPAPSLSHDQSECIWRCLGAGTVYGFGDGCNSIHCLTSRVKGKIKLQPVPPPEVRSHQRKDTHAPDKI
jgi:hypothetical protein